MVNKKGILPDSSFVNNSDYDDDGADTGRVDGGDVDSDGGNINSDGGDIDSDGDEMEDSLGSSLAADSVVTAKRADGLFADETINTDSNEIDDTINTDSNKTDKTINTDSNEAETTNKDFTETINTDSNEADASTRSIRDSSIGANTGSRLKNGAIDANTSSRHVIEANKSSDDIEMDEIDNISSDIRKDSLIKANKRPGLKDSEIEANSSNNNDINVSTRSIQKDGAEASTSFLLESGPIDVNTSFGVGANTGFKLKNDAIKANTSFSEPNSNSPAKSHDISASTDIENDAKADVSASTDVENDANPFLSLDASSAPLISSNNLKHKLDGSIPVLKPLNELPSSASSASTALSYSQQQSEIKLSPSKRREMPQTKRPDEPRLVINQLVLTNFKSYAGRQVIGPFSSSFSAVVGPNGSGKSNVIDSLLFVFGFRASKMRQSKLSELIHNSVEGEKLDFCQVDIHFHNVLDNSADNTSSVVPNSEIVITRKALKNNQSNYYINNKPSSYTEVTTFLRDKGVDLDHKRFLILQGEVESIAQMKAKAEKDNEDGLLEYLEDIIGTSTYKSKIEEFIQQVDGLNEICLEKETRFELIEKDKQLLEDKKDEALKFLELEKKLIFKKSIQYQVGIIDDEKNLKSNQDALDKLNQELSKEKEANSELVASIKEHTKRRDRIKSEISDKNSKLSALSKKQKDVNKLNVALEEKHKNLNSKIKKIIKNKETSEQTLNTATQKLSNYNSAATHFKEEMESLESELVVNKEKLDEIRKKLTSKTAHFTKEIEDLQTKLEPWNEKVKQKKNAIQLAESEIDILKSQRANSTKQLEESRQRLIDIKTEGRLKESEYAETEARLEKIEEQIKLGEEKCNGEKRQVDLIYAKVADMRLKTQESAKSLNNFESKNKVLASLTRLSKSGRIEGFYGRLGDLGTIDPKFDVAISTACSALDDMVVDTVETAQACIEYLRKNQLGRSSFICLNKARNYDLSPIRTPGDPAVVQRLFDLITPLHTKFAPAFYQKIRDCLVAPNLSIAKSVAYGAKRFRVVTLDGKVVDTSGTMSGGGNFLSRGRMRLTGSVAQSASDVTQEDVNAMKAELSTFESKYQDAKSTYEEHIEMLNKLKKMKPETEFGISKLRLDIESLAAERKEVLQICKTLIAENENLNTVEKYDKEIEKNEEELKKLNEAYDGLRADMADLESQIKSLEEKVMEAGGVELKIQNSKVDSTKQKIEILNQKTAGDRLAIRKLENEINRCTKVIEQSTIDLEGTNEDFAKITEEQKKRKSALEELNVQIEGLEKDKIEKESELEVLESELEDSLEQINNFKTYQVDMENKMEKYNGMVRKLQRKLDENRENLDGLAVRDVIPYISWLEEDDRKKYDGELEKLSEDEIKKIDMEDVDGEIEKLEEYMNTVKVDIEVLIEYGVKLTEYETRREDLNGSVTERDNIKADCEELKRRRLDEFMEGFNTISMTLKDMYRMITMGGNAELELVDSLDPFSEGILFSVMPPKKSWKNISNLSGGEKTLSSLALVFALHQYKPTPLYVMDEIDAALDFRNVSIVANYIKERTKNGQFIVISLRNNMFELSKQLVGIYKVNNKTKSISLQNKDFIEVM